MTDSGQTGRDGAATGKLCTAVKYDAAIFYLFNGCDVEKSSIQDWYIGLIFYGTGEITSCIRQLSGTVTEWLMAYPFNMVKKPRST